MTLIFTMRRLLACAALGALLPQPVVAKTAISIPAKVCDVTTYGANGDQQAIALSTEYFQRAIDECAAAGGGTVEVPAGNYLSAPLALRSNVRLHLAKDATLVATTEELNFRITPEMERLGFGSGWLPFISVANAENVAISGEGTIDGQGAVWWERWRSNVRANPAKRRTTDRPRLIAITNSHNVAVEGVTLVNSPSFHIVMRYSEDVDITRTRISTPWHAPNTDAIDPVDSRNVRITYNTIDCNDDHVAIKAERPDSKYPDGVVRNIYIAHNTLLQGRGISMGSETAGGIDGVLVEHNTFRGSMYGLRIKSPRGKGGMVRNVVYQDTVMVDVGVPLVFSGYYQGAPANPQELVQMLATGSFVVGDQIYPPDTDAALAFVPASTPSFSGITVRNLISRGKSKAAGYIIGVPEAALTGVVFENVQIEARTGLLVRNASIQTKSLQIKTQSGAPLLLQSNGLVSAAQ